MRIFLLVSFAVTTALASTTAFAQDGDSQRRFRQNVRNNESPSLQSNGGFKRGFAPVVKRNEFAPGPSRPPRPSITAQFQKPVEVAPRKNFTPVKPAPRIFSTPFPKTADAGNIPAQPSRPPKRAEFAPPKQVEPRPKASVPVGQPSRQIEVSEQLAAPPTLAAPPPKPAPAPIKIQSAPPPKVAQAPVPVEIQAAPAPKPVADPVPALSVPVQQAELTPPPQAEEAQPAPAPQVAPAPVAPAPTTAAEETGSTEAAAPSQVEAPATVAPKPVDTVPVKRKKKKIVRYYEDDYAAYDEYNSYGSGYGYASDEYGYGGGYSSGYGDGGSCD